MCTIFFKTDREWRIKTRGVKCETNTLACRLLLNLEFDTGMSVKLVKVGEKAGNFKIKSSPVHKTPETASLRRVDTRLG